METINQNAKLKEFTFAWIGGLSYLNYIKKTTKATLSDIHLSTEQQNFILGVLPIKPTTSSMSLQQIVEVSMKTRINWFDLIFAIAFTALTIVTLKIPFAILALFFIWTTFHLDISLKDRLGKTLLIPTSSKNAANQFIEAIINKIDQASAEKIIVNRKDSRKKFISLSVIIVAVIVSVFFTMNYSSENMYVKWAKEAPAIPNKSFALQEVLENKAYFSHVEWTQVTQNGNKDDVDKFVMYQAIYTEHGVKVPIRTIFQVFAPSMYAPVEASADGELVDLPDWNLFLIEAAEKFEAKEVSKAQQSTKPIETQEPQSPNPTVSAQSTNIPPASSSMLSDLGPSTITWRLGSSNQELPVTLDGEPASIILGQDTPNGVKLQVYIHLLNSAWNLSLKTDLQTESPFEDWGDLREGYGISVTTHAFDKMNTEAPEVIVMASNQSTETYVWVFAYNFIALENGESPLDLIFYTTGQGEVHIEDDKLILPYGSQGLFDEYRYIEGAFIKQ